MIYRLVNFILRNFIQICLNGLLYFLEFRQFKDTNNSFNVLKWIDFMTVVYRTL